MMRPRTLLACALLLGSTQILFAPMAISGGPVGDAADEANGVESVSPSQGALPTSRPEADVLLIPNSIDDVVGMYDPQDGAYLGDLITENPGFSTPINAIPGPDGNIYVSEQLNDKIFVFDQDGTYLYTYADETDGLNNVRGIEFRGNELFVTSGDLYIARFDGPHSRLPDFVADESDPFDLLFLADGSLLVADIQGTDDNIRYYDAAGVFQYELFDVSFPQQLQTDPDEPGAYLNVSFSADQITDFDLDGTIHDTWFFNGGRGGYRLGNGNILLTAGDGVWEMDPDTGELVEQENTGSSRYIELLPANTSSIEHLAPAPRLELMANQALVGRKVELHYVLPRAARVAVDVFEVSGRHQIRLQEGFVEAGPHSQVWEPANQGRAASGVYCIRLTAGDAWAVRKVVITR